MGRSPSTISHDLRRNKGLRGYRIKQSQKLSEIRHKETGNACTVTPDIRTAIEIPIRQELSLQQVMIYLARHKGISLHHETVYQLVYTDNANGGDLYTHLRVASKPYRKPMAIMTGGERSRNEWALMSFQQSSVRARALATGRVIQSSVMGAEVRC